MRPTDPRTRLAPVLVLCALATGTGCGPSKAPAVTPVPPAASGGVRFVEVTDSAGIRFQHVHGGYGKKLMPETVGSGCAWLDADGDGWQDLVLVNCTPLPGSTTAAAPRPTAAYYRNRGDGTFDDRTAGSGLDVSLYGQAVTAADYDGDGDSDLLITCLGPNHLFQNDGHGKFRDVTRESGLSRNVGPWDWHAGAAWLDYDRDGRLDLIIARYVKWTPALDRFCGIPGGVKRYCPPTLYPGETNLLYRNLGGGKFQDVSAVTGISRVEGKWFQPLVMDHDRDGWLDILVSSDGTPTALFRNQGGKRFVDIAVETGLGLADSGVPKSGMGIDAADWRNLGREGVLIGNFPGEKLSLFQPDAGSLYEEATDRVGMGESSLYSLTFGVAFLDADLDGWRDAFIANGHIDDYIEQFESRVTYAQRPLFYRNQQGLRFQEVGSAAGPAFSQQWVARGCAVADYDRDGDPDLLVLENNRSAHLLRNEHSGRGNWLRVELRGPAGNPLGIGATVKVTTASGRQQQMVRAGASFYSQNESPLLFGIGSAAQASVEITWPNGKHTPPRKTKANQSLVVEAPTT